MHLNDLLQVMREEFASAAAEVDAHDANHDGRLSPFEFDRLAADKVGAGLQHDAKLPVRTAKIFFRTIPWSH